MNRQIELLARVLGDLNELYADHMDLHECIIFHALCGRVEQLAENLDLDWQSVEEARLRQEREDPGL